MTTFQRFTWGGAVALVLAQLGTSAGCQSSDPNDNGSGGESESGGSTSSGGASPSGGRASGGTENNGGIGGEGGMGAVGGLGGVGSEDCYVPPGSGDCGTCEMEVEPFCEAHSFQCDLPADETCESGLRIELYQEGCGYLRVESQHWLDDHQISVWSLATEELVYFYTDGRSDNDCLPVTTVGEEPVCDDYETLCDSLSEGFGGSPF